MTHPSESAYQGPMDFDRDTPTPMEDDTEALFEGDEEDDCCYACLWGGVECDKCAQERGE